MVHTAQPATGDIGPRPMLICVDGLQQPPDASVPCDVDGMANGTCLFKLPLWARRRHRRVRVRVDEARPVRLSRKRHHTPIVLTCVSASAVTDVIRCEDGALSAGAVGTDAVVCDYDRACDGTCTFAFQCPLCTYDVLYACARPCFMCPGSVNAQVPVGQSQFAVSASS